MGFDVYELEPRSEIIELSLVVGLIRNFFLFCVHGRRSTMTERAITFHRILADAKFETTFAISMIIIDIEPHIITAYRFGALIQQGK